MKNLPAIIIIIALTVNGIVYGQIPQKISYQGFISSSSGIPAHNGNYDLRFDFYDLPAGGTLRHTETHNDVEVDRGSFSVILGPLPAIFSESLYVEITALAGSPGISTDLTFSPRSELTSAPYAFHAWKADTATYAISAGSMGANNWFLNGNAGTVAGTNFIGTTDNQAFDIRTFNTIRVRITSKGQIETYNTGKSVFLGEGAGQSDDIKEKENVFIGYHAGFLNSIGYSNTATGGSALYNNNDGYNNTATGGGALFTNSSGFENTASGLQSLFSNTTGLRNTAHGSFSLFANTLGSQNTANGVNALFSNTEGNNNTAFGTEAGYSNVAGSNATAVGARAMYYANNTGTAFTNTNVAFGYEALRGSENPAANTGIDNSAIGYQTLYSNTAGWGNTATGFGALFSNTTGSSNTASGVNALYENTEGFYNAAYGRGALRYNTTGDSNTAVGYQAGISNITGSGNVFLGHNAGYNETGSNKLYIANSNDNPPLIYGDFSTGNIGLGTRSPASRLSIGSSSQFQVNSAGNLTKINNVSYSFPSGQGVASSVLQNDGSGNLSWATGVGANNWSINGNAGTTAGTNFIGTTDNQAFDVRTRDTLRIRITTKGQIETYNTGESVFIGRNAGANDDLSEKHNIFIGPAAGYSNTSGHSNIAMGWQALFTNSTGYNNTAVGFMTLWHNGLGYFNTGIGWGALYENTEGHRNTAVGDRALAYNSTGAYNCAIGESALFFNTEGSKNSAYGTYALYTNTTGIENVAFGQYAGYSNDTGSSNVFLGYRAGYNETGSNKLYIANSNTTIPLIYGDFSNGIITLGSHVSTTRSGSFMLGDNSTTTTLSNTTVDNQLRARFANGYYLYTNSAATVGVGVAGGGNSWGVISDSTRKENLKAVDGEDFLQKISAFKLSSWNYKGQDPTQFRHYGPMAQDFYAAFGQDGIGTIGNDTIIASADFDGVNLIAIQALEKRTADNQSEIDELKALNERILAENAKYREELKQLRGLVNDLYSKIGEKGNRISSASLPE